MTQTEREIHEAWQFLREKNSTIPDNVIDFMRDAALLMCKDGMVRRDGVEFTGEGHGSIAAYVGHSNKIALHNKRGTVIIIPDSK